MVNAKDISKMHLLTMINRSLQSCLKPEREVTDKPNKGAKDKFRPRSDSLRVVTGGRGTPHSHWEKVNVIQTSLVGCHMIHYTVGLIPCSFHTT